MQFLQHANEAGTFGLRFFQSEMLTGLASTTQNQNAEVFAVIIAVSCFGRSSSRSMR
jgi:hypothetical protein